MTIRSSIERIILSGCAALLPCSSLAQAPSVPGKVAAATNAPTATVTVTDAWARATVPQQKASGAFFTIVAKSGARLVGVASPVAGVAELHEMKMDNHVMHMNAVAGIDLPAGTPVELKPGGYHVMLMDLKQQLKEGESLPLTLTLEYPAKVTTNPGAKPVRENIEITAPIRSLTGMPAASPRPGQHSHR